MIDAFTNLSRWIALVAILVTGIPLSSFAQDDDKNSNTAGSKPDDKAIEFYQTKVKPLLKENCFECHANDPEDLGGSLALTSRNSILRGGDTGPAVDSNSPSDGSSTEWDAIWPANRRSRKSTND